jgi:hypothetical protein
VFAQQMRPESLAQQTREQLRARKQLEPKLKEVSSTPGAYVVTGIASANCDHRFG